ncbi:MAG: carbon-nitrogen hydrolase family protein [Pseudomonadales bacterium]|nr:carbon-nitrogen hydrolase family protein [Pseudomonadales bacterium]
MDSSGVLRLALLQCCSGKHAEENQRHVLTQMQLAAEQGAQLMLLQEHVMGMHPQGPQVLASQAADFLAALQSACARLKLWLVAGTLPWLTRPDGGLVPDGRMRAACFVIDDQGQVVARYDKIHMFDVQVDDTQGAYRESDRMEAGDKIVLVDTPWGRLGLTICYDLRFSELFSALTQAGADFIAVPSAFTQVTGAAHWSTLLRARAIENQVYIWASGQCGSPYPGRFTWGHSLAVDPWGRVVAQAGEEPVLLKVDTDLSELVRCRRSMPMSQQRRLPLQVSICAQFTNKDA